MSIGDAWAAGMGSLDKEGAFKLLDAFYEAGGNFIDTANNYQNEQSETWIGEWMTARKNRDLIVLGEFASPIIRAEILLTALSYEIHHTTSFVGARKGQNGQLWREQQEVAPPFSQGFPEEARNRLH
jgi:hypothetical protein